MLMGIVADGRLKDPLWNSVVALLMFNGADGATSFTDSRGLHGPWGAGGNAQLDTAQYKFGGASLLLDGTGDYAQEPSHADFQVGSADFTVEAWIRTNVNNAVKAIVAKRDNTSAEEFSFLFNSSGQLALSLFSAGSSIGNTTGATTITTGVWHHVAGSRVGGNLYVHLDGVMDGSGSVSGAASTNTGPITVGRDFFNLSRDFNGWIDSFRMTKGTARYGAGNFTPSPFPFPLW